MTEEQFKQLGIPEEQAKKAAAESAKELEGYVPKHRYDELTEENKTLKTAVEESKTTLEDLKKTAGNSEELKAQIERLQTEAKEKEAEFNEKLKETRMTNAIKLAVNGIAQDSDLVAGLIDRGKLILSDDGKITGLEEQVKSLRETKGFLFKEENKETKPGFQKIGGNQQTDPGTGGR
ncbi:MAG: phage scaffolding protein, partial [Alistipes sp.]|nr:phage scaffolding protein [Alistipes sp.]